MTRDDALKALDEALLDGLKQGFAIYVQSIASIREADNAAAALDRFSRGVRMRIDCHAKASAEIVKIMGASK
jgi:hypothetical protein